MAAESVGCASVESLSCGGVAGVWGACWRDKTLQRNAKLDGRIGIGEEF